MVSRERRVVRARSPARSSKRLLGGVIDLRRRRPADKPSVGLRIRTNTYVLTRSTPSRLDASDVTHSHRHVSVRVLRARVEAGTCRTNLSLTYHRAAERSRHRGRGSAAEAAHQIARIDFERGGEPEDVDECHVAFTPLEAADVGAMELCPFSERLLTQPESRTAITDARTEGCEGCPASRLGARRGST